LRYSSSTLRFSPRSFWLAWVAVLGLAVAIVPTHLAAQESTPAAQTSTTGPNAVSPPGSIPGNPELSEKEEHNVFRHTELVHTLARALHMDVETTARLFEFINFAILALAIFIPLFRVMPRIFRQRSATLRHSLESARQITADANQRLSAVEAKLASLDKEIAQIRAQVEEESKSDEARIKSTIGEESSRIVAAAEQEIAAAAASAKRGLRHFAADLAIEQAAKQLVLTPDTDRALIAEFVSDSGKGGRN
jgi:F-type H+-transporting ATPase subunit b